MSTKQQTNSNQSQQGATSLQFDPTSFGTWQSLLGSSAPVFQQYASNPFGNQWYNLGLQQSLAGANAQGQQGTNNVLQNMLTSGLGGSSGAGYQQAMLGQAGRNAASLKSNANIQNIMAAFQRQMGAAGTGLSYTPLMTGEKNATTGVSNSTQTTSGTGTWLPQLLSSAAGMGLGMLTGGASSLGGLSSMFGGAPTAVPGVMGATGSLDPTFSGMNNLAQLMGGSSYNMPNFSGMNPLMFGGFMGQGM